MAKGIKNRIIGYGVAKPEDLLANPNNWRTHPKQQQEALKGVLQSVGVVQNVIVNQRTGYIVDGHMRVMVAMREGLAELPITYVDLSASEEATILASLDPIAALAGIDEKNLQAVLADAAELDASVRNILFEEDAAANRAVAAAAGEAGRDVNAYTGASDPETAPTAPEGAGDAGQNVDGAAGGGDDAKEALTVVGHCTSYQQQLDGLNALRALGIEAVAKP